MKVQGIYTVEAVFVMSICIWVLMAICYGGLYVHDMVVMESFTNEEAAAWLSRPDPAEKKQWCETMKKELDSRTFLIRIRSIKTKSVLQTKKVQVYFSVPVSQTLLKKIFMEGKSELLYETAREDTQPAQSMWNRDVVKG